MTLSALIAWLKICTMSRCNKAVGQFNVVKIVLFLSTEVVIKLLQRSAS